MANKNSVEIRITKGNYHPSHNNGARFTSVDYSGSSYGACAPCDNSEEIKLFIEHAKATILRNGDIPIIQDEREEARLTAWFK